MLVRISCERCRLASLWTDDPRWFLETVCNGGSRCEATLVVEHFRGVVIAGIEQASEIMGEAAAGPVEARLAAPKDAAHGE
ncbi:MAG: hypothetical protein ACREQY_24285 [Candidatus Binatia bacterium]